jgi:hypothetical protein
MKRGTYDSVCWQHKARPLNFAVWLDNALVKSLSNFHRPEILEAGMGVMRKQQNDDGKQERIRMEVLCPAQTKDYCETSHLIDKGNRAKVYYDLGGKSRLHNWSPKLIFWMYNMVLINAYKMYQALFNEHTQGR